MKCGNAKWARTLVFALLLIVPVLSGTSLKIQAQGFGNSISGRVIGIERRPLSDINVELLDEYSRTISRTRTNGSGFYSFSGMGQGRFAVRVLPYGTDYEEQENSVEIVNISRQSASGGIQTGGFASEQSDFSLRLKKGVPLQNVTPLFAQDVPKEAKKLYEKALADLDAKREKEAQDNLRAALEIFPKYYAALERLGTEYISVGKPHAYQAAEILLSMAVEVNPRAYTSWYGLAYARYSLANYPEALLAAQKAIDLNSRSAAAVFLSGALFRHTKKFADAEKQLLNAMELSKDAIPQVHWELALLYGNDLNRFADAAKELTLFLKAQPETRDLDNIKKLIAEFERKAQISK